jgi:hypothetical protein
MALKNVQVANILLKKSTKTNSEKLGEAIAFVQEELQLSTMETKNLKSVLRDFATNLQKRWAKCFRMKTRFDAKYGKWLQEPFTFSTEVAFLEDFSKEAKTVGSVGRPKKLFSDASVRTQARSASFIAKSYSLDEIGNALIIAFKQRGMTEKVNALKDLLADVDCGSRLSSQVALELLVDSRLSTNQYNKVRKISQDSGFSFLPSYKKVLTEKKKCYLPDEKKIITESSAEVDLQCLVNSTAARIIESLDEKPKTCDLRLIYKWGIDGNLIDSSPISRGRRQIKCHLAESASVFYKVL